MSFAGSKMSGWHHIADVEKGSIVMAVEMEGSLLVIVKICIDLAGVGIASHLISYSFIGIPDFRFPMQTAITFE